MAQYYDPIAATIPFALFSKQALTQREKAREEKEEKEEKKSIWANRLMTPFKIGEAKRAGDITDKQTLMGELDTRTTTGRKFKSAEYVAPERKQYDPRRFKDWADKRYGRSGRERVELEEWTPEAKKHIEDKQIQALNLHDPNSPNRRGVFDPVEHQRKLERRAWEHRLPGQVEERRLHKIETEAYKKEYDRLKDMSRPEVELELGITDPTPPAVAAPAPLGDVSSDQPISSLLGVKGLLGGSDHQKYGSFNELVKARNAARGTEGFDLIQDEVSKYMPKGTSWGEASKAFDAANTATETAGAVETGSDVIGAAGTKATPGLGDIMTIAENFDPDKSEGEKIYDTIATGAAFAGPHGQTLSAIMKGGKFLYGMRNMG